MDEVFGTCEVDVSDVLNLCSRTAHSISASVRRDPAVEIFSALSGGVSSGFNAYIDVGLSTTEVDDPVGACVVATASGRTIAGVEADIAGAGSVATSVDTEDSIGSFIDVSRAPADGISGAVNVSDVLSR